MREVRVVLASGAEPGELGLQLRIAEGLEAILISDNEVLVQFGSRSHPSQMLRDTELTGILGKIVGRLQEGPAGPVDLLSGIEPQPQTSTVKPYTTLFGKGAL